MVIEQIKEVDRTGKWAVSLAWVGMPKYPVSSKLLRQLHAMDSNRWREICFACCLSSLYKIKCNWVPICCRRLQGFFYRHANWIFSWIYKLVSARREILQSLFWILERHIFPELLISWKMFVLGFLCNEKLRFLLFAYCYLLEQGSVVTNIIEKLVTFKSNSI